MADVFISYARADAAFVQHLISILRPHGLSIWWDRDILGGAEFHQVIESELNAARKVIVIWSRTSVASHWVRDEAALALAQRKIVPIVIDDCAVPLGFRSVHFLRSDDPALLRPELLSALGVADLRDAASRQPAPPTPSTKASPDEADDKVEFRERGSDIQYNMTITLDEAFSGKTASIRVPRFSACEKCFGRGGVPGTCISPCPSCDGTGSILTGSDTHGAERTCVACGGVGNQYEEICRVCAGFGHIEASEEVLEISIPRGVQHGTRIRLPGKGSAGWNGGPAGALFILLSIEPHDFFQVDAADLFCRLPITERMAQQGAKVVIPLLRGEAVALQLPLGVETGKQLRLRGKGLPVMDSNARGDLYIQVEIKSLAHLADRQREMLEEFERETYTALDYAALVKAFYGRQE